MPGVCDVKKQQRQQQDHGRLAVGRATSDDDGDVIHGWLAQWVIPDLATIIVQYCPRYLMLLYQNDEETPFRKYKVRLLMAPVERYPYYFYELQGSTCRVSWHTSQDESLQSFFSSVTEDCREQYSLDFAPKSLADIGQYSTQTRNRSYQLIGTVLEHEGRQMYGYVELPNRLASERYDERQQKRVRRYINPDLSSALLKFNLKETTRVPTQLAPISMTPSSASHRTEKKLIAPPYIVSMFEYGFSGGAHDAWTALVLKEPIQFAVS